VEAKPAVEEDERDGEETEPDVPLDHVSWRPIRQVGQALAQLLSSGLEEHHRRGAMPKASPGPLEPVGPLGAETW